jgi:conjugative transfer region protein TrbK
MTRLLVWGAALVMVLAAASLAGRAVHQGQPDVAPVTRPDDELARCRAAGQDAVADPACRRAWDEARARFFGSKAS